MTIRLWCVVDFVLIELLFRNIQKFIVGGVDRTRANNHRIDACIEEVVGSTLLLSQPSLWVP